MKPKHDATQETTKREETRPYAVCGAGRLVSFLYKDGDEETGWHYSFNLFRSNRETGETNQLFGPADIDSLVNLTRILANELSADGCLPSDLRNDLACLAACLNDLLYGQPSTTAAPNSSGGAGMQ